MHISDFRRTVALWLGLGTETTWSGLGNHGGLGSNQNVTFVTSISNLPTLSE